METLAILLNIIICYIFIKNYRIKINKKTLIKKDDLKLLLNILCIYLIFIVSIKTNTYWDNLYFLLFEFTLMCILVIEDEYSREIDLSILIILLLLKLIFFHNKLHFAVIIFSIGIYLLLYLISNKGIGEGDIILNGIISISFSSYIQYFRYFTLVFSLGALVSCVGIMIGSLNNTDRIPFIKFIVMGYYIFLFLGVLNV